MSDQWNAALLLLDAPSLRGRVDPYVDQQNERIRPSILNGGWSTGELLLIQIAMSLTKPNQKVCLHDGIGIFDPHSVKRVVDALTLAYGADFARQQTDLDILGNAPLASPEDQGRALSLF